MYSLFTTRLLIISLTIVWLSIFIKYESFGSVFSRSESGSSDSGSGSGSGSSSLRLRETYHKIVDKKPESDKKTNSDNSNSDSFRLRSKIHDVMHRSKTDKPYNDNNNNKPYYKQPEHPTPAPGWNVINGHGSNNNNQFYNKPTQKSGLIRTGIHKLKDLANKIKGQPNYGSSPSYNRQNGYYYNYNARPDRYGQIEGSICYNNQNYDGIIYGQIRCPMIGYDYDETACCGTYNYQYCCKPYLNKHGRSSGIGFLSGLVFVILFMLLICCACGFLVYYKTKIQNKDGINKKENNASETVAAEEEEKAELKADKNQPESVTAE